MNPNLVGSVLRLLKAEWKVSNTGSAHWASVFFSLKYSRQEKDNNRRKLPAFSDIRGLLLRGHLSYKATFSLHNNKLIWQGKPWGEKITSILLVFFSWEQKNSPWAGGWENVNTIISSRVNGSTDFCCSSPRSNVREPYE